MIDQLPFFIILPLLAFSLLTLAVGLWKPRLVVQTALLGVFLFLAVSIWGLVHVLRTGEEVRYALGGWQPPFGIEFVLDHLSAFIVAVIAVIFLIPGLRRLVSAVFDLMAAIIDQLARTIRGR